MNNDEQGKINVGQGGGMRRLKDCTVSPDGTTFLYTMEDDSTTEKNFGIAIQLFSHPDPIWHCMFAMGAAILALTERIEALERKEG